MGVRWSRDGGGEAPPRLAGEVDYLVIGAGPAGLQAAYFLKHFGLDYAVVEASAQAGSFFRRYPRGRRLISINKRHFPDMSDYDVDAAERGAGARKDGRAGGAAPRGVERASLARQVPAAARLEQPLELRAAAADGRLQRRVLPGRG